MIKHKIQYSDVEVNTSFIRRVSATKNQLVLAIERLTQEFESPNKQEPPYFQPVLLTLGDIELNVVGADEYDRCRNRLKSILYSLYTG